MGHYGLGLLSAGDSQLRRRARRIYRRREVATRLGRPSRNHSPAKRGPAAATGHRAVGTTADADEFFIVENRQQSGYDRYIPSHGLLVWHVDRRSSATVNVTIAGDNKTISCADAWDLEYNAVNSNAAHQCLEIEKASGNDGSKSSLDTHRRPSR